MAGLDAAVAVETAVDAAVAETVDGVAGGGEDDETAPGEDGGSRLAGGGPAGDGGGGTVAPGEGDEIRAGEISGGKGLMRSSSARVRTASSLQAQQDAVPAAKQRIIVLNIALVILDVCYSS